MSATRFRGVTSINEPEFTENLRDNIVTFIDWGFLEIGSYYNVNIPTSGNWGGNMHILRPVADPRYTDGQVWEGFRKNWIWESGTNVSTQPISISGVFVDNVFNPLSSGGYHINYPDGRIVFDTAQSTTSQVHLAYSYKFVNVTDSRNASFFREIQPRSFRVDNSNFLIGSGLYNNLAENRLQLPAVVVELPIERHKEPYELGSVSQWAYTDVLLHVLGEDDNYVSRVADILDRQEEKVVFMFDTGRMAKNNVYPLDYRGMKASGALTYPSLVEPTGDGGYRYQVGVKSGKMRISNSSVTNGSWLHHDLYHKTVKWTTEVVLLHRT